MALRKSTQLLPSVFQTNKNTKFLNATIDQLISEPNLQRVNSYIGRKFAPNYTVGDGYVNESTADRQNYQLEPALVYKNPSNIVENLVGYQDFINYLRYKNTNVNTHSDLFTQDYYNYSGFVDLDKLVNYGEYFWLPAGPDSVQVFNSTVDTERDYTVYRSSTSSSYSFISATGDPNPTITLARGGEYTFQVNQLGHPFWIQTEPGTSGITSYSSSTSTREVLGVINNGDDVGTVTFVVPTADAQNDQINAIQAANPDFATDLTYKQIHNVPYSAFIAEHGGIDKQTIIAGKSLVFVNTTTDETAWDQGALFDAYGFDDPDNPFDETTTLDINVRYDVYDIAVNTISGVDTIQLTRSADWPTLQKVKIKQGDTYGNREFFKNASGVPELIAPYTAGADTLYYQDGTDANRFGKIKLIEQDTVGAIDVDEEIIGKQQYTSENGVTFTNGLKVEFNSDVTPTTYADREYYVEGVGQPQGIQLTPVDEMLTPETYTTSTSDGFDTVAYDAGGWDGTLNAPVDQDYIVINRGSPDRNAWSRGNRWFHREVIEATAIYNDFIATVDDTARAKRPIIEFYTGLELYNMGTTSIAPVTVVDTTQTDALSNVNGTTGYFADGIDLQQGNTVIFSADTDADVSNKVYRVDYINQDSDATTGEIINLVEITTVVDGNSVLSTLGANNQGKQFYLDGTTWKSAQQKTKINQDPLFNVFDPEHVSFDNQTKYPSSNFTGSKLFSYKRNNNSSPDSFLGFGLTYQNFSTLGDIVFENNFDNDKFQYTKSTGNTNVILRSGHTHQFNQSGVRSLYNGWTKVLEQSFQYQIQSYTVSTELYSFEIGAPVDTSKTIQPLQVYVNSKFKKPSTYTHLIQGTREYVVFTDKLATDDVVTIKFFSLTKSPTSFYEVPRNLENNAGNDVFETLTLGQIRNHTVTISEHIKTLSGEAPGKSNLRDLNYRAYPGNIMQHSAGLKLPMHVIADDTVNAYKSLEFAKNEYTKFKNKFIDNIDKLELDLTDPAKCVDDIITFMAGKKTSTFPFYYSDMLPWGTQKSEVTYTIDDVTETEFEFATQFDLTGISSRGVLVYHNNTLLKESVDYTFDTTEAKIILTSNNLGISLIGIAVDDTIKIVEYTDTNGSFVPPTPSKLGLWPKYEPQKYTDSTYVTSKTVVQGHDGSIWIGWDDIRDDIVLEFEKRVYNNIKTQYRKELFDFSTVIPGYFRSTLADLQESNNIVRSQFGEWALKNKVRVQPNNTVIANNGFTWNYSNGVNILNKQRVPGGWREMYRWFYDTDTPHTTPWEMLGLSLKPTWWDNRYGVAPYTSGNTVLWEDLRDGKLYSDATGTNYTVQTNRLRPLLMSIIPVDEQGNLRAPNEFLIDGSVETNISNSWSFSDGGPAETAWRRSSEYPFVAQILALSLQPARYGALMFDTNLFEYNSQYDQILQRNKSYRPGITDFNMHGQTSNDGIVRVEGYNQFISEYLRFTRYSVDEQINKINNLELNLCYAMAGFTAKQYIKVIAESVTPGSQTENIFVPDENIDVYMKKSLPIERVVYSGVQIIRRENGWEMQGYDIANPFFKIIPSEPSSQPRKVTVGENTYFEYNEYENRIINIPYGTVITNRQGVFDFLVSYQRYLLSRGFQFNKTDEKGTALDFVHSGREFAFWTDQGWPVDSVLVISPFASSLSLTRENTTVDNLVNLGNIKDANGSKVNPKFFDVSRIDNTVEITVDPEATQIYAAQLDPIQYEHVLVFDNTTIFNDIIYQPALGNRHSRLKLIAAKSGDWNGTMHAPGFFINEDKINLWQNYTDYKKGDFVSFQNKTYVAKYQIDGSKLFDYNDWTLADNITTGMVKNLTNKADQFNNFFEIDNLNLEDGVDKLGKGIIGFNNKDYLEGLGLDDISQVKFYQGLIKQKGTGSAINKLIDAELTNLDQEIDYYEEWAFRVGEYGSIDSNQVIEAIIPEKEATNNPFVVHFHSDGDLPSESIVGHYHIQEKDLYKTPNNYTGDVFASRDTNTVTLNDLDSAGYARLDDVDFTVFNGDELEALSSRISELGKGKKIWIATDDTNAWGMRRIDETLSTVTSVESTGNGYLIYTTDRNHGLVKDDYVIVRAAQPIGKVAKIYEVSSPNKFTIQDATTEADIQNVRIPMYKLSSVRFSQPSDMATFTPVSGWDNKELVWVDRNTSGTWSVLQNARPWTTTGIKTAAAITANDKHGTSVTINAAGTLAVVGAPEQSAGIITPYVRVEGGTLAESTTVSVQTIGDSVDSFGASVTAGVDYVAVGAPDTQSSTGAVFVYYIDSTGTFNRRPALRPADLSSGDKFGFDVCASGNGRHLFVSAPGGDTVYVYTLVDIATTSERSYTITTDGSATFTLNFTPIGIQALNVTDENGKVYLPNKDFTLSGADITFTSTPGSGLDIVVRQQDYFAQVGTLVGHDTMTGDNFGYDIDCTYDGRYVVVGAPDSAIANSDSTVLAGAGEAYVFAQVVERFVADGTLKEFTTNATLQTKIFVEIDGVLQTETDNDDVPTDNEGSSDGFYTRTANTVTFKFTPTAGSSIVVYTGSFAEKQRLDQNITGQAPGQGESFGKSVSIDTQGTIVAIGSPGEDETNPNTGSVFIFQDSGKNYATVTTNATHTQTLGDIFYVDDYRVTVSETGTNPTGIASDINLADIPGVSASVNSAGQIVITTTNSLDKNKLTVNPGTGQIFVRDSVIAPFVFTQKINHPQSYENENFGEVVQFDKHYGIGSDAYPGTRNLVVASDRASTLLAVGFDVEDNSNSEQYLEATTTFDSNGTTFTDRITASGAAYVYELFDAYQETIANPKKMVFGQQLKSTNISELDQFGHSVAFSDNRIIVGAPQDDTTRGSTALSNSGSVYEFNNDRTSSWNVLRSEGDRVDVTQINRVALYNKRDGQVKVFLDYIDTTKGKIAGSAKQELSYVSKQDPALYDNNIWTYTYKNRLWWDTSTVHYLLSEQGNSDFRTTYWNTPFPGSTIDIYEWIESTVPPVNYTGEGTPRSVEDFTTANVYDSKSDSTQLRYYFWVSGRTDVPVEADFRTLSADSVRAIIEDPKAQGIPYVGFLSSDEIALYNCKQYFSDNDTVLSVNYDVVKNDGVLHSEFELYGRGNVDQDIPARMYRKLVDSLAGTDSVGNLVPDPFLSEVEKYGVLTQPRQGLFVSRAAALKVLVQYCNSIFTTAPFARNSNLAKLLSSENIPTVNSGEYNKSVDTIDERDFLNTAILATGYKVLVLEDENNNNYWTIYTLQANKSWLLTDIQSYNTADYWSYQTYYATGYDSTTVPKYQVTLEADLLTLTDAVEGEIAKVTSNDEGNFSMFALDSDGNWDEVIIERGTLKFNDSLYSFSTLNSSNQATGFDNDGFDFAPYDKVPADEIRQIMDALKENLFVGDYEVNMNELFFRLMEYALNENDFTQDWLFKTSFITVAHKIRSLDQYNTFKYDNTTFIEDFIEEVKPYKTKIREYVSKYDKLDLYDSDTTDFDIHAFYDESLQLFRKPSGDYTGDEITRTQGLNKPWSENYGYRVDSLEIVSAGTGYLDDPTITISAPQLSDGVQATATAKTNGDSIVSITVTNKGSGYTQNPTVTITGSGSGLVLSPRISNSTTRSFDTTIKFDRISYSSAIKDWTANTSYTAGDIVAYKNTTTQSQEVYDVVVSFTSGATFSVENDSGVTVLTVKADADLSTTADRIAAYYYPTDGMIGDDLELLQKGTGYLSNKVQGAGFEQSPGFDSGNFDTVAFDALEVDSDGIELLGSLIDTTISSLFTDLELGTRPEDINIDGAGFVDTYNSHAPEELIPGRVYDTLDMEVYTHASHDYEKDGNAPEIKYTSFTDTTASIVDFQYGDPTKSSDDFEYLIVYKNAERVYNFTVDYESKEVVLSSPLTATDILHIYAYGVTGEKLVGEYTYEGDGSTVSFVLSNVPTLTQQSLVFVDGVETATTVGQQDNRTLITFATAPDNGAHIHVFTFNQATSRDAPSRIALQTTTMTAGTFTYSLDNTVNYAQPFSGNTVVEIDNVRLRPANSKYHTGDGSTTQFAISDTAGETTIGNVSDIGVAVIQQSTNTTLNAVRNIDYTVSSGDAFITMTTAPADGDTVIVYNSADAEYTISGDGTEITIDTGYSFTSSSVMRVNTFANHDPLRIQTKVHVGQGTGSTTIIDEFDEVGFDSAGFDRSTVSGTVGTYSVDRAVANVNNFWVTVDGARLHPGDYITNGSEIIMSTAVQATISGTSVVVITHISENQIQPSTGFRIFQDMNGNIEYLRMCKDATTEVKEAIDLTDEKIYVTDVSVLPFVTPDSEFPGVVFIGSERITYREVSLEDNYISGLRRGTAGTQIYTRIAPGFLVVDGSRDQYLPATDTHTKTWYDLGSGTAADGLGLQQSSTVNANFLKDCEAQVPNYRLELNEKLYMAEGYVEDDYVEELL